MTVHVKCPGCGCVLAAPEKSAGTVLSCPKCHNQFIVPSTPALAVAMSTSDAAPPLLVPAAPPMLAGANHPNTNGSGNTLNIKPPPISVAGTATPQQNSYPPGAAPPIIKPPSLASNRMVPTPPVPRQVTAAKFIAADTTATKIDLGADGRLPSLQLEELQDENKKEEQPSSNPWLLISVLAFSIAASVAMLFIDPSSESQESLSKADARRQIQFYYLPDKTRLETGNVRLKPYEQRLRDALLAYNRGDFEEERRLYRDVLNMLHVEGKNEYTGLTSNARGDTPPSDRHLESLVSALLSN